MNPSPISIAGRAIGPSSPPYVVAELSANHNGDIERALAIMEAARDAGADAVKLQTYTPDTMTIDCNRPEFQVRGGLWDGNTLYELYGMATTPWDWHPALFAKGQEMGLTVFSTPFDETAVDLLEDLGAPAYKIASFESVHLPLVARAARTGKPMIISTGMADEREIDEAVAAARDNGCEQLMLLHCISGYPTAPEEANLLTIGDMRRRFGVEVGLSDHTLGTAVATAAVALGATAVEKHVTLRRVDGGPDSAFSLEPDELTRLVTDVRDAWAAVGEVNYSRTASEEGSLVFRRSLFSVADIAEGELLTTANIRIIRPGHGLAPKHLSAVLGRRAARPIRRGTPIDWMLIEDAAETGA